ncbi:MAG: NAD(P)/FAD-dependent oxidoreductase [Chitinophagaceae bacterium]
MNSFQQHDTIDLPRIGTTEEPENQVFDVAIIGGGLAGLSLSIQLAKQGLKVILFEKEKYPFHRVCGEYISLESWNFLENLGYPLSDMDLPIIKNLLVSAPNGQYIEQSLPLGGFGISRHKIDYELAMLARANGVYILEGMKVTEVRFLQTFIITCSLQQYQAKVVCGAFGKRSNLDIKLKRSFAEQKANRLNNYIGVKYHIQTNFASDTIALHNFKNGYCGISRIEEGKYCLCYLTTSNNLRSSQNSIVKLEEAVLQRNPFLKKIFNESKVLYQTPLTISQVSFDNKSQVENHMLMVGDAGGMITPLCGNGMSMAFHGSKIASELIAQFFSKKITRAELEEQYIKQWNRLFQKRLQTGRLIQKLFGKEWLTNVFINAVRPYPRFISYLIRQTHGDPF